MEYTPVAFITGAAVGIGEAIALKLANDGFNIAINDLPREKDKLYTLAQAITQKGRKAIVLVGDVTEEANIIKMVDSVVEQLGGLDVMVANAGLFTFHDIVDITVEEWERVQAVNVRGVFLCYKHAAKQMIKQGRGGRIIGAGSSAGKQGTPSSAAYSASKFAVAGLTQSAAGDLGKYHITVNAYAAGPIDTPMIRAAAVQFGDQKLFWDELYSDAPLGYIGKPEDIASIVSYLASKESHYITGQSISVNGGIFFD